MSGGSHLYFVQNGIVVAAAVSSASAGFRVDGNYVIGFTSNGTASFNIPDTDFSRLAAGSVSLGGGSYQDQGGTLTLSSLHAQGATVTALPTPTAGTFTTATTGGTLPRSTTYYYRVSATNSYGESLAFAEVSKATGGTTDTNTITVVWTKVQGSTGYKVYGRTTGAEQLIGTIAASSTLTFVDTGSVTPSSALPTANTTSQSTFAGKVGIGNAVPAGLFDVSGNLSGTPVLQGAYFSQGSTLTFTDNATAGSGTTTNFVGNSFNAPTLAATNTSVTTTNAYTNYIVGAPIAGTNETLTNSTALNIASNVLTNTTNGYGLQVNAPSGATNNYSAIFMGGNVGIGTATPTLGPLQMASGAYVTTGGVWTNASDRKLKENFTPVDPVDVLNKIDTLPITQWNYKSENSSIKHIGPVAQDFHAIFGLGNDDTSISTIDPAGVALLGIQALSKQLQNIQGSINGNVNTSGTLTISQPEVLQSTLTVLKQVTFSGDTVGEAEIKAGAASVRIKFSEQYQYQPIVALTPTGPYTARYWVDHKDASGFTIELDQPETLDLTFDWYAFGGEGAKLTVSDGTTQDITLVLAPSSSAAGTSGSGTVNAEPASGSAQSSASSSANGNQTDSAGTATPVSSPDTTTSSNLDSTSITTSTQSGATSSSGTDNAAQPGSSEPVTTSEADALTSSATAASPQGQAVNAVQ